MPSPERGHMDRETLEQMLAQHQAELGRVQASMLRMQGAIALLKEMIRQIDDAEEADDGPEQPGS